MFATKPYSEHVVIRNLKLMSSKDCPANNAIKEHVD